MSCIASKGIGAHLLKVGSKRRRTQAEIKEQLEEEELSNVLQSEADDQIKQLKQRLAEAEEVAENKRNANDILRSLVDRGEVE